MKHDTTATSSASQKQLKMTKSRHCRDEMSYWFHLRCLQKQLLVQSCFFYFIIYFQDSWHVHFCFFWFEKVNHPMAVQGVVRPSSREWDRFMLMSVRERSVNHLLYSLHEMSSLHLSSLNSSHIPLLAVSQETKPLLQCVRPVAHRSSSLWGTDYWISISFHCNDERGLHFTMIRSQECSLKSS